MCTFTERLSRKFDNITIVFSVWAAYKVFIQFYGWDIEFYIK